MRVDIRHRYPPNPPIDFIPEEGGSPKVSSSPPGGGGPSKDVQRLHELGYAQELKRGMTGFSNFAVSFTIISILSGCLTLFCFAMDVGGPAV